MENRGLVHLYYGNGKGKTTAALGLVLRAAGQGLRVVIVQFLKNMPCGEVSALEQLPNVRLFRGQSTMHFFDCMTDEEKRATRQVHEKNFQLAMDIIRQEQCDLLVLDEVLDACQLQLLDENALRHFMENKPSKLEVVMTAHKPIQWALDLADYITEMRSHAHPHDKGIPARRGIEF